jgi:colanic acid biosynthesis glycosyl transferase WcaI
LRILIYGLNYSPELTGIGKYTGEMAAWLVQRGHEVRVVAAPPYYPAWRVREDYRGRWYRTETVPGEPVVHRTPLYVPKRPTGIKRIVHLLSFVVGSFPVMLRQMYWQPDVVFTVEPTFFCAPLALFVAKGAGGCSWLHVQDFEVDAAFELGLLPAQGPIHDAALRIENFLIYAFDRVSGISSRMVERAITKGVPYEKAVLFPNWVDVETIYPIIPENRQANRVLRELASVHSHIDDKVILLYSGNMGAKQGLERLGPLAESFRHDERVHFVFCGDGAFRDQLEAAVLDLPNVSLLPLQPLERLNELLNAANIHLLPQRASAADLVMPSRLSAMLASGRPVIATAHVGTQVASIVEGCGLVVPPEDSEALHAAVQTLVDAPQWRTKLGCAAREYAVTNLSKQAVLSQFDQDLEGLIRHT